MTENSYLTAEGLEKLRKELEELKGPAREALALRLRSAIQMGDLSENADYIKAKEDQSFLEGRIQELEAALQNVIIIDDLSVNSSEINIGNKVTFQEEDFPPECYFLVGPKEADPVNGRISHKSPVGEALLGHAVGDLVIAETPNGTYKMKILKIE